MLTGLLIAVLAISAILAFLFYYSRYMLREEWKLFAALGKELGIPLKNTPQEKLFPGKPWLYGTFNERFAFVRIKEYSQSVNHRFGRDTGPGYYTEIRLTAEKKLPYELFLFPAGEKGRLLKSDVFITKHFANDFIVKTSQQQTTLRFLDEDTVQIFSAFALWGYTSFKFDGAHLTIRKRGAPESMNDIRQIKRCIHELLKLEKRLSEIASADQR